ncbi:MAG: SRPBCC family protein [Pseudomonadota bacterium]
MSATSANKSAIRKEFVIARLFDAPCETVWKAFTEPGHLKRWWGPKGFTVERCSVDLRPGGLFHYCLRAPDGQAMWGRFVYREIVAPQRLAYVVSFSDETGGVTRHPMHPTWPLEMTSTTEFANEGGKTKVTVRWAPLNATEEERRTFDDGHESMRQGWGGTFDQLAAYLAAA